LTKIENYNPLVPLSTVTKIAFLCKDTTLISLKIRFDPTSMHELSAYDFFMLPIFDIVYCTENRKKWLEGMGLIKEDPPTKIFTKLVSKMQ
jgi:hypothetical protein